MKTPPLVDCIKRGAEMAGEERALVLEVYPCGEGWCAEGQILLNNGNKYTAKVEIQATARKDLRAAGEDDDNPPEREEAVKELLDQLITLLENPILKPYLPTSVKVTLLAIKGTRKLLEKHRAAGRGSIAAGFNLAKLGQEASSGNDIIVGALRAQRLYGKC